MTSVSEAIAKLIVSLDRSSSQSTGTPLSHLCNVGTNGCRSIHASIDFSAFLLVGHVLDKGFFRLLLHFANSAGDWNWPVVWTVLAVPDTGCLYHSGIALFLPGTIPGNNFDWDNMLHTDGLTTLLTCSANIEVADTTLDGCWANFLIL
eukprot:scaffold349435_cov35-Attheya_sp.AAC.2